MQFNIYAFGESISGLQVYYADGVASIGDPSQSNATDVLPVYFTASSTSSDQYTWTAHSASEVQSAAVSDKVLYLANDGSDKVGFVSSSERSATDSKLTNVWWLYGRYVMTKIDGATFYAEPTSNGWYKLTWSTADQSGTNKKLVTLRTIEPSTNSVLA
ncbi:hypothetical protein N7532_004492 [Penicillium argentinense]|uniref:Uncharacterized protein n=1 Tax=Penicillium argentinense TaxID=1131581 RepID=A0A9W9KFP4_9EURO|nr:uncharacterized protein N7532_004492 [Penicillium argentinense]KAJ5103963.1 hypothetical protein N7532_004492 [Penicillium argentinense]